MTRPIELYRVEPQVVAGWSTAQEASRLLIWDGPATLQPMSREWERAEAARGTYHLKVGVRTPENLFAANAAIMDGREYRIVGAVREADGYTWTLYLADLGD